MNRRGLALWVYVCLTLQTGTRVQPRFAQLLRRDASKEGLGGGGGVGGGRSHQLCPRLGTCPGDTAQAHPMLVGHSNLLLPTALSLLIHLNLLLYQSFHF